jgi:hypothetical protein
MNVSVNIPDDLYRRARELAESQQVSVDDVITSAFAEQMVAWERLKKRAVRGSREAFFKVLDKVPDVDPKRSIASERHKLRVKGFRPRALLRYISVQVSLAPRASEPFSSPKAVMLPTTLPLRLTTMKVGTAEMYRCINRLTELPFQLFFHRI